MALAYQIDSTDGLDQSVADMYEKSGEKYVLAIEGLPEDPVALKNTLTKVREERKLEEKKRKGLQEQYSTELKDIQSKLDGYSSVDIDKYKELEAFHAKAVKEQEQHKREEAEREGNWEALEKQLNTDHLTEIEKVQQKYNAELLSSNEKAENYMKSLESMQSTLHSNVADSAITRELAEAKGNINILRPHIMPHVKVIEENGEFLPRVLDAKGEIRMSPSDDSTHMTIKELVLEIRENPDFQGEGIFAKDKKPGGSNSQGNNNVPASTTNPWLTDPPNLTEQARIIRTDTKLATNLKREAGLL